jgi:hypothetical protein
MATHYGERTTMRTRTTILLALLGTTLLPPGALAVEPALIGMERVLVMVEPLPPPDDFTRFGLTREGLEAAVREGLGPHAAVAGETNHVARLRVNLAITPYRFWSWGIRLELERAIPIEGQAGAYTRRVVWSDGRFGGALLPQDSRRLITIARELAEKLDRELGP